MLYVIKLWHFSIFVLGITLIDDPSKNTFIHFCLLPSYVLCLRSKNFMFYGSLFTHRTMNDDGGEGWLTIGEREKGIRSGLSELKCKLFCFNRPQKLSSRRLSVQIRLLNWESLTERTSAPVPLKRNFLLMYLSLKDRGSYKNNDFIISFRSDHESFVFDPFLSGASWAFYHKFY